MFLIKKQHIFAIALMLTGAAILYSYCTPTESSDAAVDASLPNSANVPSHLSDNVARKQKTYRLLAMQLAMAHSRLNIEDLSEDEQMEQMTNTPEQIEWRDEWVDEGQDNQWSLQMEQLMNQKADALLSGDMSIHNLKCRETVCRMFLQFDDFGDAEAFTFDESDDDFQYKFELLNPDTNEDEEDDDDVHDDDEKRFNYEVLVKRERPVDMPERIPAPQSDSAPTEVSGDEYSI